MKTELAQEEVDAIIRTKRKAREPKACYPCHTRKVKCDRNLPCDACVKRDHPDLCSYERPSKKRQSLNIGGVPYSSTHGGEPEYSSRPGSPGYSLTPQQDESGTKVTIPKEEWDRMCAKLRAMEDTITQLRSGMEDIGGHTAGVMPPNRPESDGQLSAGEREGIHAPNDLGSGTVHLGSRSVVAYMMGLGRSKASQEAAKTLLEDSILPKLGLDNESTLYPFVDLWSTEATAFDVTGLCQALPDDTQCREYFVFYRDIACTIYPVVTDCKVFESTMELMLQARMMAGGVYAPSNEGEDRPFGVSLSWMGLFFSVLASGVQSSELSAKERELTSQVYICCAYQCLRMTNFLSQPTLEAIETLLIVGNVLSLNMNPGCAYILLGMTIRMALALGLQVESHRFSPCEQYLRRRVWWALAWQDSHFSMSYDRPSATALCQPDIPYRRTSQPGQRSYCESMFRIISLTLEIVRGRILSPKSQMSFPVIQNYKDEVARIFADGAPHLRDRNFCVTREDHLERLALKLHCSYITSELCRPALKSTSTSTSSTSPTSATLDAASESIACDLRKDCITALERTVAAYLELHSTCSLASRSWIGIQRAISSAFLLAILQETQGNTRVHSLLKSLETVITDRANSESVFVANVDSPTQHHSSISGPSGGSAVTTGHTVGMSMGPQWAKSMSKSLKALQKLNNAIATGGPSGNQLKSGMPNIATLNAAGGIGGFVGAGSGVARDPTGGGALVMPVTPESSSSGEWNYGNMFDRAAEYIQAPLWG